MGSRITKDINDTLLSYYTRDASGNLPVLSFRQAGIMAVYSELKSGFEPAAIDTTAERDSLISYLYAEEDTAFVNEVIKPCLTDTQKLSTIFTMLSTGAAGTVDTILANIYSEKDLGRLISNWARDNEISLAGSDLTKDTANLEYRLNEHHLYGGSRLGLHRHDTLFSQDTVLYYYNAFNDSWKPLAYTESGSAGGGITSYTEHTRTRGKRFYELSNHLGNVLTTITDRKLPIGDTTGGIDTVKYFVADISTVNDYYPFGMLQPERSYSLGDYRFGFQGQEKDDEIKGEGNSINYKYRMHDPRVGRFFAVDPLATKYPYNSTYAFSENSVIAFIELEGLEKYYAADGEYLGSYGTSTEIRVVHSNEVNFARTALSDQDNVNSGYFQHYLLNERMGSKLLSDMLSDVRSTVIKSIANNELGLNLGETTITTEYRGGSIASYSDSKNNINIDITESYFNDKFFIINTLVKENTHRFDKHLQKGNFIVTRELNGYLNAVGHWSFNYAPEDYKLEFLQGAGIFIWMFRNMELISTSENAKRGAGANFDAYMNAFEKNGIKFDFTRVEEILRNLQDFYDKDYIKYTPDNHEVDVEF